VDGKGSGEDVGQLCPLYPGITGGMWTGENDRGLSADFRHLGLCVLPTRAVRGKPAFHQKCFLQDRRKVVSSEVHTSVSLRLWSYPEHVSGCGDSI
jgi:hypothetical protein